MSLSPGQKLGPYEIVSQLGAGGMGEVYRARDSKLKRDVAVKVLPADVAGDRERLARFQREAEVLASLNHPHIAQVYGFDADSPAEAGRRSNALLVMELVEGEDLSQRISRGAIPIDEALAIARQIAEALEAAHESGIVHRDLKPANVKVRDDGTVKVLDFGLAKAGPQDLKTSGPQDPSNSPTITSPAMTMRGVILGTAAYMSPEQAKGKAVDRRADIWAFGCVLYEMLTGTRTFKGDDVTDIITSVMRDTPDWNALPTDTPASIRVLLRRCLEKDSRKRAPHISIARLAVEDATTITDQLMAPPAPPRRTIPVLAASLVAVALIGAAGTGYWTARRPAATVAAPVLRSTVILNENLNPRAPSMRFSLSPDGRKLAYIASDTVSGRVSLWIRSLDGRAGVSLPGTDGANGPFWSPDGQFVAFYAPGELKKISASGGEPVTIASGVAPSGIPGSWSRDDVIVFTNAATLARVPASGGTPQPITQLDAGQLETSHDYPYFLPDGRHLLYSAFRDMQPIGTFVMSVDGGNAAKVVDQSTNAQFAAGHLIYAIDATVLAQPFDVATRQLAGTPSPIAEAVLSNVAQKPGAAFSVSQAGTLIHQSPRDMENGANLVWATRAGARTPILEDISSSRGMSVSPDSQHVAFAPLDGRSRADVWVLNLARGTRVRLTTTNNSYAPLWMSDSRTVLFATGNSFFTKSIGGGAEQRLPGLEPGGLPLSLSPDDRAVLFERFPGDIFALPVDGSSAPAPFVASPSTERWAQFSPDGRWVAYSSNESGAPEVYVKRSGASPERWQISLNGGLYPRWSRDGRELFFWNPGTIKMLAARLNVATTGIDVERIETLFDVRPPDGFQRYFYDVTNDGRFIMEVSSGATLETKLALTANWPQLLGPASAPR